MSDAYSQPERLQFKYLAPDNGLSSSIASCIIQDHKGLMWIGTPDGLNRYDGFNFVVYKNDPGDSTSLADNVIKAIFEDHNKNLLIGTENGLCLYDRGKDRFLNYVSDKSSPLKRISCTVSKIIEDSVGNLWLATSVGLIYLDRLKNKISQYTHDPNNPESLSNDNVEAVLIDRNGSLWVATRKGLNLFLPGTGTFKHFTMEDSKIEDLSNTIFINMIEDQEGNLWLGSTEGLYCMKNNPENRTEYLKHYEHDVNDKSSLSINLVRSLFVDDAGNLWIGTDNGGINLFNKEKQTFWHYRKDEYDTQSLNNEAIEAIYQDNTGNLWFGTYTGGLNISIKNRDAIIKYQNLSGAPFSLSHNTVTCFAEDHQGQTWVGTDGGGLNLFEKEINRFLRINMDNSNLSSNAILCILEDSNNRIWLGTWAGGLVYFDSKTKSFTTFSTKTSGIQDDNIFAIAEGDKNDLWLGSFEHGLIHYLIREKKFTDYTMDNSGLGNQMVIKIAKYSKGRLLIGTAVGFQIFSPGDGHFVTYTSDPDNANSLSYPRVTDILVENDSCVWIGTPDGLNKFNPENGSFRRYYEKDGLPSNFIKGLVSDNSGVLWVTTNHGVCRFDYKQREIKNFTKADGFQSNEFSERSILKTNGGDLLMGGTKGLNLVYPEKISENKNIPDILITDLKIFNISARPGALNSPLSQNITETKSLTLSHELSVLTFYFAAMDFSAPEKNQYAYMMENFDRSWIYPGNKGEATYTNLSPGKYVFRVKGSNNDGLWNEKGTSIQITVLPPWWNTLWFRLIVIVIIILIISSIFILRVQRLKKQKILLERLVEIKTSELYELNASKDKFFSIIAHDLKNPFNTIIGFSEMLKEEIKSGDKEAIGECAGVINKSAVQTFMLLENLLEWANSQRGKILFSPIPIKLSELYNEELSVLNDMAKGKDIELKSSYPENLTIIADKNMMKTILRNLISNAIKFTHKNGKVEVNALISNKQVEISVSDTGIGMSDETKAKLFRIDADLSTQGTENEKGTGLGLFLCKEFIEKHGGKIWVESKSGKGSIFKFTMPVGLNHSV
jgi:signal transduction histidine kinase/ligand-binding sensor domain-containing protein